MIRHFYDLEFVDNGFTIEPISIGVVSSDGREYYAVNADVAVGRITGDTWLRRNVWPSLPTIDGGLDLGAEAVRPRARIAVELRDFLLRPVTRENGIVHVDEIELWADYGAYDHVALCQFWGRMVDLPRGIPMFTHDIQQEASRRGNPHLPVQRDGHHNALADARHVQRLHAHLAALGG